ncbi:MAG TPA: carbon-nitrogen hydrolase family protein [Gemmatimonadales bacterium]|nr:carbon-nitrogen hydrolase family protein [Gemmatimonadales bacterium]
MRVTVCELPHAPRALAEAWAGLCEHTSKAQSELVLLPELVFVDPVWEEDRFDPVHWSAVVAHSAARLRHLPELCTPSVVGTRPVSIDGRPFNQGFIWTADAGVAPLRRKFHLPAEPGYWEDRWFDRGDPAFPDFCAGPLRFGLNICTELWALETYPVYAERNVQAILSPRATGATTTSKWLSVGVVAAVRSGAFSLSSNRVDPTGACGGVGWIIDPEGRILATTGREQPFATVDIDLAASAEARTRYPRYVFSGGD